MAIITESPREKPRKILYKKELKESGFKKYYIKKNLKKATPYFNKWCKLSIIYNYCNKIILLQ
uniref:Uncharacterized protein n=1 Tax=viral metagenome TaxID=1070528 RepID=A0A6C0HCF4_9ZZZZ